MDTLSDAGFPVQEIAIVGTDLRMEEKVTGRLTNGRAALTGAVSGGVFGPRRRPVPGPASPPPRPRSWRWSSGRSSGGAVAGAAFGFTSHLFQGGVRDFTSRNSIVAGRYDVLVTAGVWERAQTIIQGGLAPAETVVVRAPLPEAPVDPSVPPMTSDGMTAEHEIPAQRRAEELGRDDEGPDDPGPDIS